MVALAPIALAQTGENAAPVRLDNSEVGMMSTEEVAKCGDRLQYLYEELYAIRKSKRKPFPDIEADLSMLLRSLIVSRKSVAFQEVMRLCDKCADAIDSRMRERPHNLYGRRGLTAEVVGATG